MMKNARDMIVMTAQSCTENGGRWVQIEVCQAIGCPKAPPPYCECKQKCLNNVCVSNKWK